MATTRDYVRSLGASYNLWPQPSAPAGQLRSLSAVGNVRLPPISTRPHAHADEEQTAAGTKLASACRTAWRRQQRRRSESSCPPAGKSEIVRGQPQRPLTPTAPLESCPNGAPKRRKYNVRTWSGLVPQHLLQPPFAAEIFELCDADKNGKLSKSEWGALEEVVSGHAIELKELTTPCANKVAEGADGDGFRAADTDKSGDVDLAEWHQYIKAVVAVVGEDTWAPSAGRILRVLRSESKPARIECRRPSTSEHASASETPPSSPEITHENLKWLDSEKEAWLSPYGDSAVKFGPKEVATLRKYFQIRDAESKGKLSEQEVTYIMEDIGRTPPPSSDNDIVFNQLKRRADRNGDGSLTFDEFVGLLTAYYHAIYERTFNMFDRDGSGSMSFKELVPLMKALRVTGLEIKTEHIYDLVAKVDKDGDSVLNFTEFCDLMQEYRNIEFEQLSTSSGFGAGQVLGLRLLFESADADSSETLSVREIANLMEKSCIGRPLNTRADLWAFSRLFARMDSDQSSSLDFEEFVRLMRTWSIGGHVGEHPPGSTKLNWRPFGDDKEEILDGWAEDFESRMDDVRLSNRWGRSLGDIRILRQCFEFCDVSRSGKIERDELGSLLACFLLPDIPENEVQVMAIQAAEEATDCDFDEGLSFSIVVEIICRYQEELASYLTSKTKEIPHQNLLISLYTVGEYVTPDAADSIFSDLGVAETADEETILEILNCLQSARLRKWRQRLGFSKEEILKFRHAFKQPDSPAEFSSNPQTPRPPRNHLEVEQVFDVLGALGLSPRFVQVMRAIDRADQDHSGTICFDEFLQLMRYLTTAKAI